MNNIFRRAIRTLSLAVSLSFMGCVAQAQFDVGSLVGTIRDQSGAAVAGASITATNTATNIESSATSNNSGDYEIPSLHVGVYSISAKATNYAEAVAENIAMPIRLRSPDA